jgi:hypothetical protein
MVTEEPPAAGPFDGETLLTVGTGFWYVNWSATTAGDVPSGLVTVMLTVPVPAGETAVMEDAEFTVKLAAGVDPKATPVAPVKSLPVMVTEVPPAVEPLPGATLVTAGPKV